MTVSRVRRWPVSMVAAAVLLVDLVAAPCALAGHVLAADLIDDFADLDGPGLYKAMSAAAESPEQFIRDGELCPPILDGQPTYYIIWSYQIRRFFFGPLPEDKGRVYTLLAELEGLNTRLHAAYPQDFDPEEVSTFPVLVLPGECFPPGFGLGTGQEQRRQAIEGSTLKQIKILELQQKLGDLGERMEAAAKNLESGSNSAQQAAATELGKIETALNAIAADGAIGNADAQDIAAGLTGAVDGSSGSMDEDGGRSKGKGIGSLPGSFFPAWMQRIMRALLTYFKLDFLESAACLLYLVAPEAFEKMLGALEKLAKYTTPTSLIPEDVNDALDKATEIYDQIDKLIAAYRFVRSGDFKKVLQGLNQFKEALPADLQRKLDNLLPAPVKWVAGKFGGDIEAFGDLLQGRITEDQFRKVLEDRAKEAMKQGLKKGFQELATRAGVPLDVGALADGAMRGDWQGFASSLADAGLKKATGGMVGVDADTLKDLTSGQSEAAFKKIAQRSVKQAVAKVSGLSAADASDLSSATEALLAGKPDVAFRSAAAPAIRRSPAWSQGALQELAAGNVEAASRRAFRGGLETAGFDPQAATALVEEGDVEAAMKLQVASELKIDVEDVNAMLSGEVVRDHLKTIENQLKQMPDLADLSASIVSDPVPTLREIEERIERRVSRRFVMATRIPVRNLDDLSRAAERANVGVRLLKDRVAESLPPGDTMRPEDVRAIVDTGLASASRAFWQRVPVSGTTMEDVLRDGERGVSSGVRADLARRLREVESPSGRLLSDAEIDALLKGQSDDFSKARATRFLVDNGMSEAAAQRLVEGRPVEALKAELVQRPVLETAEERAARLQRQIWRAKTIAQIEAWKTQREDATQGLSRPVPRPPVRGR